MKRSRAKLIGLGLALMVGKLHAADDKTSVIPAPPNPLPATLRAGDWIPAGGAEAPVIWFPARKPLVAATPPATVAPAVVPISAVPDHTSLAPAGTGSNPDSPLGPLPAIPSIPDSGSLPATQPSTTPNFVPAPNTSPSLLPAFTQPGQPLPPPREVPPRIPSASDHGPPPPSVYPYYGELPTAPPELLIPAGVPVPGKHGSFGSPGIRLSRDYPPLTDLFHTWWADKNVGDTTTANPAINRFYFRAEYLMWWVRPQQIPVLATTSVSPASSFSPGSLSGLGFLGDPATRTLLGPGTFGGTFRTGMRLRAGYWFDECGTCGIDGSFFFLGRKSQTAAFSAPPYAVLTRPFFSPNLNTEFGEIVAFPGVSNGTLTVDTTSFLWGADVNIRKALCGTCDFRAEWFAGYRFLSLDERLQISEYLVALPGNTTDPVGTRVVVQDRFETRNTFNGGQLGLAAERNWGRISLDVRGSVALGNTHQELDITGSQIRLRPGATSPMVFNGGLLAAGPNLGHFSRDRFSVVPEATINLGYWLSPTVKAYVGYNFLYWSNVIRPGDQIDRVVDVSFVPNPPVGVTPSGLPRPQPQFRQSDLWVNGIQFGLMGRW